MTLSEDRGDLAWTIDRYSASETLGACWEILGSRMRRYGFDRLIYARKPGGSTRALHNLADTLVLSSYGEDIDRFLVSDRRYLFDVTTHMAISKPGAFSWGITAERFAKGLLTEREAAVHLATLGLGLAAGNTVGLGRARHGDRIMAHLKLFDLLVFRFPNAAPDQVLSKRQIEVPRLAAERRTTNDIAQVLSIAPRTIEKHFLDIRRKLNVSTTLEAVFVACQQGQL